MIVSRADPRLSLHRLLLEGKLTEIRSADLAFTMSEAAAIFELAGIELTADQLAALHGRTEGWAAGLRLAALSLEGHDNLAEVVRTFAGDDGSVADYFVEQVLQHASPEVRAFMLKTSVVDPMTPGLVDALLGQRVQAGRLLDQLERSGAFISRVGLTYRYHPMFRELLGSQLRHRMPDVVPPPAPSRRPLVRPTWTGRARDSAFDCGEGLGRRREPGHGQLARAARSRRGADGR